MKIDKKSVTKLHLPHNMYYETEASRGSGGFKKVLFKEDIIMSCFNFGNGNGCCWILILIILFCVCGNGNGNDCGNSCGNNCGNNCNPCC